MFTLLAQITNPVLPSGFGGKVGDNEGALTNYIVLFWRTLIILGGLSALLFLVWGAFDWILAGGDEGKIKSARQKITNSVVGLIILVASVALVDLVGNLIGFDLLQLEFPTPETIDGGLTPGQLQDTLNNML